MSTEVTGIDHIYIAVSDMARSVAWYDVLMPLLGFRRNSFTIAGAAHVQYYNRHFGYVLRPAAAGSPPHDPYQPGLHHFCLRVADVAALAGLADALSRHGIMHSGLHHYPEYAEDYHALFFQDPDGIRLEVTNFRQERRDRMEHWED